jgi:allantoate deiminase
VPFLGSRAVAGNFDQAMLAYEDADGIRMDEAIRAFGLDPSKIGEAALDENVLGFVEIHIEQGPVLEAENLPLAVVGEIIGQTRLGLRFTGQANHAGTTPMHLRRDALAAAAEWINAVEIQVKKAAAEQDPGLVATVGKIAIEPNAGNVIPGSVSVSLDLRSVSNRSRSHWVKELICDATTISQRRGIEFEWVKKMEERRVDMDKYLSLDLKLAIEAAGFPLRTMPSGAGHDAMVMAARLPTAMLFLRSPGGISHHPDESVRVEDVEAAIRVGLEFLMRLAQQIG